MTITPFYRWTDADFDGADPGIVNYWPTVPGRFFIGRPEIMMVELPSPMQDGYTANGSSGEVEHGLFGGGSGSTRFGSMVRRYTLPYQRLIGRDYSVIHALYKRNPAVFGPGPWCYVPPEDTNRLTYAQSLCGAENGEVDGWRVTTGTLAYDSVTAPAIFGSGVMAWTGMAVNDRLIADAATGTTADLDHAAPYLEAMPHTGYLWVENTSGTATVEAQLQGVDGAGNFITGNHIEGPPVVLTGSPQMVAVTINPGDMTGAAYVVLALKVTAKTGSPNLKVSAPQLSYTDEALDSEQGAGIPRVIWPTSIDRAVGVHMTRDVTVTLAETVWGAA